MADDGLISVEIKTDALKKLAAALKAEEDGKALRRELGKNMREALKPAAADAKAGIMSMPAKMTAAPGLRSSIARRIRPEVRLSGRSTGARIKAKKIQVRGFANAPKRTQSAKGWRRRVYGSDNWVTQHGKVDWFDRAMSARPQRYAAAVKEAMDAMAERIARRTRS